MRVSQHQQQEGGGGEYENSWHTCITVWTASVENLHERWLMTEGGTRSFSFLNKVFGIYNFVHYNLFESCRTYVHFSLGRKLVLLPDQIEQPLAFLWTRAYMSCDHRNGLYSDQTAKTANLNILKGGDRTPHMFKPVAGLVLQQQRGVCVVDQVDDAVGRFRLLISIQRQHLVGDVIHHSRLDLRRETSECYENTQEQELTLFLYLNLLYF